MSYQEEVNDWAQKHRELEADARRHMQRAEELIEELDSLRAQRIGYSVSLLDTRIAAHQWQAELSIRLMAAR